MKNLFKNLMLVAVAAMAFTACQNDNGEMDMLVKKTIINGVATIDNDDTRSGFVGSETTENEDGTTTTTYQSAWDGGETIKLYINYGAAETTATVDAEGKFTAEFEGDFAESCTISACSPAEAWSSEYSFTIPTEQTPRTNSVDPAAHILKAQAITVTNGSASFKMQHEVAYGKMTVNTPAGFVIDHVDIELNGAWYGYDKSLSYTINADNVENNTFWFATDVIEVSEMTVTAYDADDKAYTKTVTMNEDKTLKFQYYKVSTFSVSNLKVYEEPSGPMFTSAETGSYGNDKYIYFYSADNTLSTLKVNAYGCFSGSSWDIWNEGTYTTDMVQGVGMIYTGQYTTYGGINTGSITVIVSHVEEGYKVVIKNVTDSNGNVLLEEATYVGPISGLTTPDLRTQLEIPNVESSISGKTLTLTWEAVENAEGYLVECTSSSDIKPISTTETTATITVPTYGYYSFSVQAVVSEDSATYRSSEKAYIEYIDPREVLSAPTNITATVDGPSVTISWDAVEGADGYQLRYYLNGNQVVDVDDTTKTIDLGYNQSDVWIYVSSVADDTNDTYRSSEPWDASVKVSTDMDPNNFADVMATDISWDSEEGCFTLTTSEFSYFHLEVNSANRPNNNSLLPGDYTYGKNENQFRVKYNNRYVWAYGDSNGSMNVSFVDGEYIILINVTSGWGDAFKGTVGYKGMPDGWVAPDGSGEGGETPEPEPEVPANIALTTWNEGDYNPNAFRNSYIVSGDNISMKVWITTDHGANATSLGETHNYQWVATSLVGNPNRFSTQNIVINGVEKSANDSSTMSVVNNGDGTFNVSMNLNFTDGTSTTITYSGAIGTTSTEPETPGEGGGDESETPGDGDNTQTPELVVKDWAFDASLDRANGILTLTGEDGTVVTAKLQGKYGLSAGTYYFNNPGILNASDATLNGEAVEADGTITINDNTNTITLNLTINGVNYIGTSKNPLF